MNESLPQSLMDYIKCTNVTNENIQETAKRLFHSSSFTWEYCNAIEQATRR